MSLPEDDDEELAAFGAGCALLAAAATFLIALGVTFALWAR